MLSYIVTYMKNRKSELKGSFFFLFKK
jgi:hypothetical protein